MTETVIAKDRLRTWIEVDKKALAHNYGLFRALLPSGSLLMAVAKSNAYGHGLYHFVPAMEALGADWVGVDSIVEASALRKVGVRVPILVLGYTLPARLAEAADLGISLTLSSFDGLEAIGSGGFAGRVKVHVKIDTGLHRQGFLPESVGELIRVLKKDYSGLEIEGLYTHFAQAKDPDDLSYTRRQIAAFNRSGETFLTAGYRPLRHASATAGALLYPGARLDMVRLGIGLMGLWPSSKMASSFASLHKLRPILSWRTVVSEVKRLPRGERIGYELTEELTRDSDVGVCPIGYWHGFPRGLGRVGEVLIRGRRARVLGTVSMDMITIDLTDIPGAAAGDTVTLLGRDGDETITADQAAARAGQSPYELLTRLNPLIQKYYF